MDYMSFVKRHEKVGKDLPSSLSNKARDIVNRNFKTSPSFMEILMNDNTTDAIVNKATKHDEKLINFRPGTEVNIGSVIQIGTKYYLLKEVFEDAIYVSGEVKQCNSFFPAITDKTKVLKQDANGQIVKDKFGDPVYIWTGGEIFNVPCIAESSIKDKESNNQLNLPDGRLKVSMKYQPISNVKLNETFKMYDNTYKITHIDLTQVINGIGIMIVIADIVPSEVIS